MKKVAVVGAKGFVGSQIAKAVVDSGKYELIPVVRGDPIEELLAKADIIIHSANPARRWMAEQETAHDFDETVEKTARLLTLSQGKRFVLISSLSCRTQLYTNYGRHRRACELMALTRGALVVRLGPMFEGARRYDMLHDILEGKEVFVSEDTCYAYASVVWVGHEVVELLEGPTTGIREIGACNSVRLGDIRDRFHTATKFWGRDETQVPEGCGYGPDANDVFAFAKKELTCGR